MKLRPVPRSADGCSDAIDRYGPPWIAGEPSVKSRPYHLEHVRRQLIREIGWAIQNKVRDPRVPMIVSVTDLKLSADTRNATVFVNVYGDERTKESARIALNRAAPFIQRVVGERIKLRHLPKLLFKIDTSIEHGMHIEEILRELKDDLD